MMLGVPAKVAGCKNIIVASPPSRATGKLTPEVVYVAHKWELNVLLWQVVRKQSRQWRMVLKVYSSACQNQFVTQALPIADFVAE